MYHIKIENYAEITLNNLNNIYKKVNKYVLFFKFVNTLLINIYIFTKF